MICNYKCWQCNFKWKGYRVIPVMDQDYNVLQYMREKGPGMTLCPECKRDKVTWTNYERFAKWIEKTGGL